MSTNPRDSVKVYVRYSNGAYGNYVVTPDNAEKIEADISRRGVDPQKTYRLRTPTFDEGHQSVFYVTGVLTMGFTRFPVCELGEDVDLGDRYIHPETGRA